MRVPRDPVFRAPHPGLSCKFQRDGQKVGKAPHAPSLVITLGSRESKSAQAPRTRPETLIYRRQESRPGKPLAEASWHVSL